MGKQQAVTTQPPTRTDGSTHLVLEKDLVHGALHLQSGRVLRVLPVPIPFRQKAAAVAIDPTNSTSIAVLPVGRVEGEGLHPRVHSLQEKGMPKVSLMLHYILARQGPLIVDKQDLRGTREWEVVKITWSQPPSRRYTWSAQD